MDKDKFNHICNAMLLVANHVSPTGVEQRGFVELMVELQKAFPDAENDKEIFRRFTSAIYDGLAYGNWPKPTI